MRVLAIDTATRRGSVAVAGPDGTLAERSADVPGGHLEWLVPAIAETLGDAGLGPDAVDGLVVSIGPGGFTGLRVGVATAVLWARARDIPMLGLSTLEIIAAGVSHRGLVLAALDARRGEITVAMFRRGAPSAGVRGAGAPSADAPIERLTPDLLATVDTLPAQLGPVGEPIRLAGDAMAVYGGALVAALVPYGTEAPAHEWWPRAAVAAALGRRRLVAGERHEPIGLVPRYVPRAVAREFPIPT
jgi:tRNA threonylcarbamoyladenosine biosynthesis protein TsaB